MADPFRKPTPGEPFIPNARQTGEFIDAAIFAKSAGRVLAQSKKTAGGPGLLLIKNNTGGDLSNERPVVGIGNAVIEPADRTTVVFERPTILGETPEEGTHEAKFGVLVGPVADGGMQTAVVDGVTWVRLAVEDDEHGFAEIEDGSTDRLKSAPSGGAQILWKEDSGEERWALVRIGVAASDAQIVVIQSTVGPGKAGTGRVYEITNSNPVSGDTITISAVSPTRDIVVINFRPNYLASGVAYLAHKVGGFWVIENDACFQDFMS